MQLTAKRHEKMMLVFMSLMSLTANLPIPAMSNFVDQRILLFTLGASATIALFHYLQVLLSMAVVFTSVGANLPDELASVIGICQPALAAALAVIILVALLNRVLKLLPTGIATPAKLGIEEWRLSLLAAISKGDQATLLHLLTMEMNINFMQDGTAPILLAAEKGYSDIIQILIRHGADFRITNAAGMSPIDIALSRKFIRTAEILYLAAKEHPVNAGQTLSGQKITVAA
ncbi:MAG: hypothetical protein HY306_03530 [Nitrosomonadales bacterium]|nr:hypothetical protein [Nitrosomonadales bacterium]